MESAGWWTTFFEGPALELWRRAHGSDESRGQAADAARALCLTHGERVLDVPCGNGRLALELAARGARVSGLDACAEFVAEGRRRAAERGLNLGGVTAQLLTLLDEYGAAELEAALIEINAREVVHVPAVRQLLEQRRHAAGQPRPTPVELPSPALRELVVRPHDLSTYDFDEDDDDQG